MIDRVTSLADLWLLVFAMVTAKFAFRAHIIGHAHLVN